MLKARQKEILKAIVEEYINTAKPVSSNSLCKIFKCSSATMRSEMAILEEIGYLDKAHVSSGRIPTEKGYRYYVNDLMVLNEMNGEEMLKLQRIFKNSSLALNDSIELSLQLISELTSYTGIVLGKASHQNKLQKIEAVPLDNNSLIIIAITDLGHIEHKKTHLPNYDLKEIKKTVDLINELIVGTPIDEVSSKLEFEIKPIIGNYVKQADVLYKTFYNVFNEMNANTVNVFGRDNLLKHEEFNDVDKMKQLLTKFDDNSLINEITSVDDKINIMIGDENTFDNDLTVIQTTYKTKTDDVTIAVVGPKRMEYKRVISLLEFIKENIESKEEDNG